MGTFLVLVFSLLRIRGVCGEGREYPVEVRVDTKSRLCRDERMDIHRKDIAGESESGQTRSIERKKKSFIPSSYEAEATVKKRKSGNKKEKINRQSS